MRSGTTKQDLPLFILWKPEGAAEGHGCGQLLFQEGSCGLGPAGLDAPVLRILAVLHASGPFLPHRAVDFAPVQDSLTHPAETPRGCTWRKVLAPAVAGQMDRWAASW